MYLQLLSRSRVNGTSIHVKSMSKPRECWKDFCSSDCECKVQESAPKWTNIEELINPTTGPEEQQEIVNQLEVSYAMYVVENTETKWDKDDIKRKKHEIMKRSKQLRLSKKAKKQKEKKKRQKDKKKRQRIRRQIITNNPTIIID